MSEHVITPLYACSFELSHAEYQSRYDDLMSDGYRLMLVDGYLSGSALRYGGIWIRDEAAVLTRARHGLTSSEYKSASEDMQRRGYTLKGMAGLSGTTATTLAAVWNDGSFRDYRTQHDMSANEYQAKLTDSNADGFKVIYVTGYALGTNARFAAIWSSHNRNQIERHNLSSSEYQTTFVDFEGQGFRIAHVSAYEFGGKTFFAGIWVKEGGYDPAGRHNMSVADFKTQCTQFAGSDNRMTCMSGYREDGKNKYAAIWVPNSRTWLVHGRADASLAVFDRDIESFMKDRARNIPGGSLAVTRNGELVLARGYSWITEFETPVEPTSLFRLASVSKTLTGAAIVLLKEQGKLDYSDKIVDLIDMPGTTVPVSPKVAGSIPEPVYVDARINDITVGHLLHHVGGWNSEISGDPMLNDQTIAADLGMPLPITRGAIIRWKDGKRLDFTPGTVDGFKYSNYGYMLLGEIIETITGVAYEEFAQQNLLAPLGIRRMRLGRSLLRNKLPGEVLYHSSNFELRENVVTEGAPRNAIYQYGGCRSIENIAAHGGWVASAVDLVRYASSFDDRMSCPILAPESVDKLFAQHKFGYCKPGGATYYGCGWFIDQDGHGAYTRQSHGGGIEGTATQLERWQVGNDKYCAALLFNRDEGGADWGLFEFLRQMTAKVTTWPTSGFWHDYF